MEGKGCDDVPEAKKFLIPRERLKKYVSGRGLCIAPDTVMVDGIPVALIYRVMPSSMYDSGWRFFTGTETDDYLANSRCNGVYDLNTVVNYCPDVLPLLDSPPYSAFRRDGGEWLNISNDVDWRLWS